MAEQLRVAVVRGESLMEQGILRALLHFPDLEVEVLPGDAADLAAGLVRFRPDAVIADDMDRGVIDYVLSRCPGTVVITMSLDHPTIGVYRSRFAEVNGVADLVEQLRLERRAVATAGSEPG